jgi:branched-chain amino acid transport system permease protein
MVNLAVAAIVLSGLYALVAFAWVLLFKTNGILSVALGAQIAVGAYLFNQFVTVWRLYWPLALFLTLVAVAAFAVGTHALVFSKLVGRPEFVLVIAGLGLASVLKGTSSILWGSEGRIMREPFANKFIAGPEGIHTTTYGLVGLGLSSAVLLTLVAFFKLSRAGVQMRAAAENAVLAAVGGIRVHRMYILGWFIALSVAALAGVLFAYSSILSYSGPESLGLRGASPALVGGLDSFLGVVPGALIVSFAETFGAHWFGGSFQEVAPWIVILVVLLIRPRGLFGSRAIERV